MWKIKKVIQNQVVELETTYDKNVNYTQSIKTDFEKPNTFLFSDTNERKKLINELISTYLYLYKKLKSDNRLKNSVNVNDDTQELTQIFNEPSLIILFTGHIGAGKNYIAKELTNLLLDLGFTSLQTSFSSNLKKIVLNVFGLLKDGTHIYKDFIHKENLNQFLDFVEKYLETKKVIKSDIGRKKKEVKEKILELSKEVQKIYIEEKNPKLATRICLQKFGTEIVRDIIDKDFWVETLFIKTFLRDSNSLINTLPNFIFITDWRFPNEYEYFEKHKYLDLVKSKFPYSYQTLEYYLKNYVKPIRVKIESDLDIICNERLKISKEKYLEMLKHESEKYVDLMSVDFVIENK